MFDLLPGIEASGFPVNPVNMTVNVNSTAALMCAPPFSEPAPSIYWKKNGHKLNISDPRIIVLDSGNLYITEAQPSDAGSYQCIAQNLITQAKRRSEIATLAISCEHTHRHMHLIPF